MTPLHPVLTNSGEPHFTAVGAGGGVLSEGLFVSNAQPESPNPWPRSGSESTTKGSLYWAMASQKTAGHSDNCTRADLGLGCSESTENSNSSKHFSSQELF